MRIPWHQAIETLSGMIPAGQRAVVAIAGPPASGKSTLAEALARRHGEAVVIGTDSYLPDYEDLEPHQYDLPEHSALDELAGHLRELLAGSSVQIPEWCFQVHRRIGSRPMEPAPLIIVEGIHALQPEIASLASVRALVDAPADHRLARNAARELSGERGWGVEAMTEFIQTIADPTFDKFLPEYRAVAHAIIDNPGMPTAES